jgi:hypothetical protein
MLGKLERALVAGEIPLDEGRGHFLLQQASRVSWVVYAKPPLAGPQQVVRYVARYTRRIAISNSRLLDYDSEQVTFSWKDRSDDNRRKKQRVSGEEFARRFLQHVLPPRFVRIRHFGLLANRCVHKNLERCRILLDPAGENDHSSDPVPAEGWAQSCERIFGVDPLRCPACKIGRLAPRLILLPSVRTSFPPSSSRPPP